VSSIDCEFRSELHYSCAFWPTAVFIERRRRTLLGAFFGHLTSTLDSCAYMTFKSARSFHMADHVLFTYRVDKHTHTYPDRHPQTDTTENNTIVATLSLRGC